jgi:hypothetical protein
MAAIHLWKFPKELIPELKEQYRSENWLWLIKKANEYLITEHICPVCPASINKIKEVLKPIFLADIEVLYKEGKQASHDELCELFAKYVSSEKDINLVGKIPTRYLRSTIAIFANADMKARRVPQLKRSKILATVLKVGRPKFSSDFCDEC